MKKQFTVNEIIVFICAGVTLLLNTVAYFFLPDKIATQLTFSGAPRNTSTLFYLVALVFLVAASAIMTVFSEKKQRFFAISLILTVINIICVVINLFFIK